MDLPYGAHTPRSLMLKNMFIAKNWMHRPFAEHGCLGSSAHACSCIHSAHARDSFETRCWDVFQFAFFDQLNPHVNTRAEIDMGSGHREAHTKTWTSVEPLDQRRHATQKGFQGAPGLPRRSGLRAPVVPSEKGGTGVALASAVVPMGPLHQCLLEQLLPCHPTEIPNT